MWFSETEFGIHMHSCDTARTLKFMVLPIDDTEILAIRLIVGALQAGTARSMGAVVINIAACTL